MHYIPGKLEWLVPLKAVDGGAGEVQLVKCSASAACMLLRRIPKEIPSGGENCNTCNCEGLLRYLFCVWLQQDRVWQRQFPCVPALGWFWSTICCAGWEMRWNLGGDPSPGIRGTRLGARSCSILIFLRFFVVHLLQPECPFTVIFQNSSCVQQSSCLDSLLIHCKVTFYFLLHSAVCLHIVMILGTKLGDCVFACVK